MHGVNWNSILGATAKNIAEKFKYGFGLWVRTTQGYSLNKF